MKLVLIIAISCVALVFALWVRTRLRVLRLARCRAGYSRETFIQGLVAAGIPEDVAHAVSAGFRTWASAISPDFPVLASDPLTLYQQIVAHDFEDIVDSVLAATRRRFSGPSLPATLSTVEDVARFVAGCERL